MIEVWYRPVVPCGERFEVRRGAAVLARLPTELEAMELARLLRAVRGAA